jgi:hypothetical protein
MSVSSTWADTTKLSYTKPTSAGTYTTATQVNENTAKYVYSFTDFFTTYTGTSSSDKFCISDGIDTLSNGLSFYGLNSSSSKYLQHDGSKALKFTDASGFLSFDLADGVTASLVVNGITAKANNKNEITSTYITLKGGSATVSGTITTTCATYTKLTGNKTYTINRNESSLRISSIEIVVTKDEPDDEDSPEITTVSGNGVSYVTYDNSYFAVVVLDDITGVNKVNLKQNNVVLKGIDTVYRTLKFDDSKTTYGANSFNSNINEGSGYLYAYKIDVADGADTSKLKDAVTALTVETVKEGAE